VPQGDKLLRSRMQFKLGRKHVFHGTSVPFLHRKVKMHDTDEHDRLYAGCPIAKSPQKEGPFLPIDDKSRGILGRFSENSVNEVAFL
jgi:hypothetical protein